MGLAAEWRSRGRGRFRTYAGRRGVQRLGQADAGGGGGVADLVEQRQGRGIARLIAEDLLQQTRRRGDVTARERHFRVGDTLAHRALTVAARSRLLIAPLSCLLNLGQQLRGVGVIRIQRQGVVACRGRALEIASCQRGAGRIAMHGDLTGAALEQSAPLCRRGRAG